MKVAAFKFLKNLQEKHSKVKDISYEKLETQQYMTSPIFKDDEVNILHALRAKYINVKANFSSKYQNNMLCPLCLVDLDDQQHVLKCGILSSKFKSKETLKRSPKYEDIFADHGKQKQITHLFKELLQIRTSLVGENLYPESAPSNSTRLLEDSDNLHKSIVHCPLGK